MPVEGSGGGSCVVEAVVAMILVGAVTVEVVLEIFGKCRVMKSVVVVQAELYA
jgi:hypothetical protein